MYFEIQVDVINIYSLRITDDYFGKSKLGMLRIFSLDKCSMKNKKCKWCTDKAYDQYFNTIESF